MKERDNYYLRKILKYIDFIFVYVNNIEENNGYLKPNDQYSDGVVYKFIQLKEEFSKLSNELIDSNIYLKETLKLLNGFRNRLTHDYENVSYSFFNEIIKCDLPKLKSEIENIISVVS